MGRDRELPPPLEMICLNALFQVGEGNVEEVRRVVAAGKPLAYTTVLTLLDRLARRGVVARRKQGRGYRYFPTVERDRLRSMALKQFLEYHFGGSADELRAFLENPPAEPRPELLAANEPQPAQAAVDASAVTSPDESESAAPKAMAQYAGASGRTPDYAAGFVSESAVPHAAEPVGDPAPESEM